MRVSLEQKLLQYINENEGWHKKVHLFVAGDEWGYSPESIGRGLRKLAEDEKIQVGYYDGVYSKNLAKYCSLSTKQPKISYKEIVDDFGNRKMIQIVS